MFDFEQFAQQSRDLLCIANTDGYFQWLNPRWSETLGWTDEELKASPFLEFVHEDDRESTVSEVARLAEGLPTVAFVNRYRCKDGQFRHLEWSAQPGPDGILYAAARDITARQTQKSTLERHLRMWDLAGEIANIGYWHLDVATSELTWSREIYRIHGLDPETFTPTLATGIDAYHPDDRAMVDAAVGAAMQSGEPFKFLLRLVRPGGEIRQVISHGMCTLDEEGQPTQVFGIFRDVTDDESLRAMNDFSYIVSHDLMEPVRTIRSFVDLVIDDHSAGVDPDGARYLQFAHDAAARMSGLIEDLLRYTRVGARVPLERTDLTKAANEAVADLHSLLEESDTTVVVGELPHGLANPLRMRQVFANLLSNSAKFRDPNRPQRVHIDGSDDGLYVTVSVTDEGIGVAEAYRERVFNVFQRLHSRESYPGSGIGLAIVRRIVEQCAGEVWLTENPAGAGTRVVIRLPRALTA